MYNEQCLYGDDDDECVMDGWNEKLNIVIENIGFSNSHSLSNVCWMPDAYMENVSMYLVFYFDSKTPLHLNSHI